jgi:putative SOS response-associated peptidase YedK
MCGRYSSTPPRETIRTWFKVPGPIPDLPARYNVAPSQPIPLVRVDRHGQRELAMMRWGLVPSWSPGPREPDFSMINARAETMATKPAFRRAFERHRCVVPASGFYEWQLTGRRRKQPYHIHRRDGGAMALAGICERWSAPGDDQILESVAIIVTDANRLLWPIHDRMPVILDEHGVDVWLDRATPTAILADLMRPFPDEMLVANPVSPIVSNPANDVPECILPVAG